jgi:hypothetical protein
MSDEERGEPPGPGEPAGAGDSARSGPAGEGASEEEIRRQLEEELRKLRVQDVLTQSVASLINLSGRRILKEDERDLDQARVGIEAVRAVVDLLEPDVAQQVRNALSELQMAYAREAGAPAEPGTEGGGEAAPAPDDAKAADRAAPGTAEKPPGAKDKGAAGKPPPGLWTPPGSR